MSEVSIDNVNSNTVYCPAQPIMKFKKATNVQQTWKEHGWIPPSDDPLIRAKWQFYRTLDVQMEEGNV